MDVSAGLVPRSLFVLLSFGWWDANLAGGSASCLSFLVFVFLFWWFASLHATTCVHVEVFLKSFFSCKDRALERDRAYQKKNKTNVPDPSYPRLRHCFCRFTWDPVWHHVSLCSIPYSFCHSWSPAVLFLRCILFGVVSGRVGFVLLLLCGFVCLFFVLVGCPCTVKA